MDKLNELIELANKMGGESWCYTQSSIFSKGYITGSGGRTIVQTYNGDVPANACQFIRTADPAAILKIAKAFRALQQRAESAEAQLAELAKQEPVGYTTERAATYEVWNSGSACFWSNKDMGDFPLYTRPVPAAAPVDEETERTNFEDFMRKRFAETMDHRRSINGDQSYMAWDKGVAWLTWKQRAGLK